MNDEGRSGFERTDEAIRVADHSLIRFSAETAEAQVLGKQLLRSATSVGANYREAHRGRSKPEFIAKCGDSLRELEESAYWLELLADSGIIPATKLSAVRDECDQLTAIFVTIIKRAKERGQNQ